MKNKFFVIMYDEDDYPYMTFENYNEAARFLGTTRKVIACNICRHQIKKYKGKEYRLYKIIKSEDDEIEISKKNIHIGAILEVLGV